MKIDLNELANKFKLMGWTVHDTEDLSEDDVFLATWKDKIIELTKDGTVYFIDMFAQKTNEKDKFGDPVYEDIVKTFEVESWEELRNILVLNDFVTAPIQSYLIDKSERQLFYLKLIEKLKSRDICKIIGIDLKSIKSISSRLEEKLDGVKLLHKIMNRGKVNKI